MNVLMSKKGFTAVLAVAILVCVAVAPVLTDESDGATTGTATINIQPGQSWSWTPTFTSGLTPTVTVSSSSSSMPADSATFSASSGYATVSSGKITVTIPSDFTGSNYYVKVKAQTTQPTQTVYYALTFVVATYSMSLSASAVYAKVGTAISDISPTVTGATAKSYSISGTLPTGLSFSTSTGKISGTPTAYKAQADYTVTATLDVSPVQTVSAKVSIGAYTNITASNYTVYAMTSTTAISVPGVSMPTGTTLSGMALTATKDSSSVSVTAGTAYNGMTVAANTGAITGTPTTAGTYVFTETYTATDATGGSTATRTVTVVVENKCDIKANVSGNSYVGHSDTASLTKNAGPSSVKWTITGITKDGTALGSSTTDYKAFSVSTAGKVTCGTAATAGTYVVTVKLATSNSTSTTSGATGAKASDNYDTATATFTVAAAITANDATFYMAEGGAYDALTLTSNITGATWTVTDYGSLDSTKISVSSAGVVTAGTVSSGTTSSTAYTLTVQAQDPVNTTNVDTATLTVYVAAQLAYTNAPTAGSINA